MNKGFKEIFNKFSTVQKWFFVILIGIVSFTALPVMIMLLIGLTPTITILITDPRNSQKLIVVGCFNLAGAFVYLFNIFNHKIGSFFSASDVFNLIVMLSSAAIGILVNAELANLFVSIIKSARKRTLEIIEKRIEKYVTDWGEKILTPNRIEKPSTPKTQTKPSSGNEIKKPA